MAKKETTREFYKEIRESYQKLRNVREFGERKFTEKYIMERLAKKFRRAPKTLENIIYHRV